MSNTHDEQPDAKGKEGKKVIMTQRAFRIADADFDAAKDKAGLVPFSRIVRILVLKWLHGEVSITNEDIKKYEG